ncbi:MAG TPA: hypothetical protein VFA10_15150 [Ktedonobacteraceae bacterium]|nr:hypothetical protein [Ktedonobacteraceae bacterium]
MINQSSAVKALRALADQVKDSDVGGHDRLNLLGDAVEHGTNADAWTYTDVHTMISPDSIVERYRSKQMRSWLDRSVTVLEIVRNTLIFTPILATWYAISQASAKYNDLISIAVRNKNSDLYSQPFLYLWQQRFGGTLPDYLTLSSIATVDVVLLCIILFCTLGAYILSNTSAAAKEQDAQRLRANLVNAIAAATLYLHARPRLTGGDNLDLVARQLEAMMRNITTQFDTMTQNTTSKFDKMAQETKAQFDKLAQNTYARFDKVAQDTYARFDKVALDTNTRFDGMAKETTTRFDTMAKDLTGQFRGMMQQTWEQMNNTVQKMIAQLKAGENYLRELGGLTSGVVQVSTEVRAAASELKTTNTALSDSIKTLIKPAEALAQQQEKLLQTVQQSAGLLQGTSATVRDIVARQQNMSKELVDVLDNLKLAVEGFDKAVRDQGSLVGQHATFLQHLQNEHDKQAQLAVLLSDTTAAAKHTLDEMNNGAIYIRSIAVDMHDLLNLQASLSTNPATAPAVDLLAVMNKYAAAAEKMEVSGKTLTVSAQTIDSSGRVLAASATQMQKASQQLKDVLDNLSGGRNGHN